MPWTVEPDLLRCPPYPAGGGGWDPLLAPGYPPRDISGFCGALLLYGGGALGYILLLWDLSLEDIPDADELEADG